MINNCVLCNTGMYLSAINSPTSAGHWTKHVFVKWATILYSSRNLARCFRCANEEVGGLVTKGGAIRDLGVSFPSLPVVVKTMLNLTQLQRSFRDGCRYIIVS